MSAAATGARIRALREAAGLGQRELAAILGAGVDQPWVSKWESGARAPGPDMLARLAAALGTTVDDLMGLGQPAAMPAVAAAVPFHALANLFPLMGAAEFEGLLADMRDNGFRGGEEIVVHEGAILDGRNRYLAAISAGIISPGDGLWMTGGRTLRDHFREFGSERGEGDFVDGEWRTTDGELLDFVLARNLNRRHLTASQRAMIAAGIARLPRGRPARAASPAPGGEKQGEQAGGSENRPDGLISLPAAAAALNVGERTVKRARQVEEAGVPELAEAVRRGAVTVATAETIAALPADEQRRLIEGADPKVLAGVVRSRRAEKQALKAAGRQTREAALAAKICALPDKVYGVVYADPPWRFEPRSRETGMDRAADNHYPTMALGDIQALGVGSLAAPGCALFLWATAPMLLEAIATMTCWGFEYRSHCVWRKAELSASISSDPMRVARGQSTSALVLGTGYWFRSGHEILLLGTRGHVPAPAMGDQWPSVIDAPPSRHSEKPGVFAELIEDYFPTLPRIELFARRARPGWDAWGNQVSGVGCQVSEGGVAEGPEAGRPS
jgi:N6-adenosine-specific RNA methylase IME4/transcriptional regulator with XRE-family HTH domain